MRNIIFFPVTCHSRYPHQISAIKLCKIISKVFQQLAFDIYVHENDIHKEKLFHVLHRLN